MALTLSGGVSLGAYQAGSLYYSSLVLRENPMLLQTRLMTGSSAGALNALLALLSVCGGEDRRPSQSAFYKMWVGFKAKELLPLNGESGALLSRKAFDGITSELEAKWNVGLSHSCDVVLGFSVTRVEPLRDMSNIGFSRRGEKVTLRVRGQGPGRPPRLTNYVNPALFPKPMLVDLEPGNDAQNFQTLKQVLFASSAFPVAFQPADLQTCVAGNSERWSHLDLPFQCPKDDLEKAAFADGGIFDNKPLAFAEKISRMGLIDDSCGRLMWREIPGSGGESRVGNRLLYFYSDLSAVTYVRDESKRGAADSRAFSVLPSVFDGLFGPSRNQDSAALLEQAPMLEAQIAAPKNSVPRMGDSLLGFFGFFERDFRSFDFYLGLWEAREYFTTSLKENLRRGAVAVGQEMRLPEFDLASDDAKRLACLDQVLRSPAQDHGKSTCAGMTDKSFVLLARLAASRLREKRTDFSVLAGWLAKERYEYRDLGLSGEEAWRAPARIKTEAIKAVSHLAESQSTTDAFIFRTAGPLALNVIEALPVERDFSMTLGPQATAETSTLLDDQGTVRTRWNFGLGIENLSAWLGPDGGRAVLTPFAGVEWEPRDLASSYIQTRFQLGGGYKFAETSGDGICQTERLAPLRRRGTVLRTGFSLTLFERLRLQLMFEAMPFQNDKQVPWQLLPGFGLQFYF
ncbi:MAG: patatin-like phospholipase family protein [Bdellovibrionales bacterium]|nr:patatin-like phospholipase family protein [Bdellovibrionales bacterium]